MASLFVIQGRDQGRRYDLAEEQFIGRDTSNAIQLRDHEASRRHAEFRLEEGGEFEVVDLQSSNGTWVNGKKVERATLRTGDRVQIGRTLLLFTGGSDSDESESILDQVDIHSRTESN